MANMFYESVFVIDEDYDIKNKDYKAGFPSSKRLRKKVADHLSDKGSDAYWKDGMESHQKYREREKVWRDGNPDQKEKEKSFRKKHSK